MSFDFGLLPSLLGSLSAQNITTPTEIQQRAIPELLRGRSLVGVAETGSGKTLAYALPMLHQLKAAENAGSPVEAAGRPRGLVLVPSRELGEQVGRVFKTLTHETRVRVRTVLGGTKMEVARRNLAGPFEILVATPGRVVQLLERGEVAFEDVRTVVLDEADLLLDMGFLPMASKLLEACPRQAQLALFTATLPSPVEALVNRLFSDPLLLRSQGSHRPVASLVTVNRNVGDGRRVPVLDAVLREAVDGGTILFVNTREQCDEVGAELTALGQPFVMYRGEMDKVERRANLRGFRDGTVKLLVATDLGARGLDVEHVGRVINYHLPRTLENYLHRIGRTARAGRAGVVINFVTPRDQPLIDRVEGRKPASAPRPAPRPPARRGPPSSNTSPPERRGGRR
jgi:ATP-dependent RNA helicase RhlE